MNRRRSSSRRLVVVAGKPCVCAHQEAGDIDRVGFLSSTWKLCRSEVRTSKIPQSEY